MFFAAGATQKTLRIAEPFQKKGAEIKDFGVEHQFNYRTSSFMTPSSTGEMTDVITRILVKNEGSE